MRANKRFPLDVSLPVQSIFTPRSSTYRGVRMDGGRMWLYVEIDREDTQVERKIYIFHTNENIGENLIYIGTASGNTGIEFYFYGEK